METFSVFYFSSIPYRYLLQRPQQLFHSLRKLGPKVEAHFVEPPCGVRTLLKGSATQQGVIRAFNFPDYLAVPYRERVNRWFLERALPPRRKGTRVVAVACATFWEPLLSHDFFDTICYDCLDAVEVHAAGGNLKEVAKQHERLASKSDIVFVTAAQLAEEMRRLAGEKPVVTVTNGVDSPFFEERRRSGIAFPEHQGRVAGYVGAIREWIDIDLVAASARLLPEVTFVMVGPVAEACSAAAAACPANVVFVGEQPYEDIPAWIERFDVALIPFRRSAISESTNPIKLYEYFQLGKPVVATTMRELQGFRDEGLLAMADDAAGFAQAVSGSLQDSPAVARRRKEVALENSWDSKARAMIEAIRSDSGKDRRTT